MKRLLTAIVAFGLASMPLQNCAAQETPNTTPDSETPAVSREQWRTQVEASRERASIMRRERRSFIPQPPTPEEIAEEASRRAREDNSLQRGDIISTNRGFYRFEGDPDKERKPEDFVRLR